ncbi:hypothetical protein MRO49_25615, partial [Escherichia coli]|uniref:hypothetical protein n=1 Tax=Escherichia coli TaxID=562 RepID=UPI0021153964
MKNESAFFPALALAVLGIALTACKPDETAPAGAATASAPAAPAASPPEPITHADTASTAAPAMPEPADAEAVV